MKEAPVPNYTAVPCRGPKFSCMANPGQPCGRYVSGSCRQRRMLWAAMLDAQSKGRNHIWWHGYSIQVETPLVVK